MAKSTMLLSDVIQYFDMVSTSDGDDLFKHNWQILKRALLSIPWVKTSERLPMDGQDIIGVWRDIDCGLCMVRDKWNQENYERKVLKGVPTYTHWMPLSLPNDD